MSTLLGGILFLTFLTTSLPPRLVTHPTPDHCSIALTGWIQLIIATLRHDLCSQTSHKSHSSFLPLLVFWTIHLEDFLLLLTSLSLHYCHYHTYYASPMELLAPVEDEARKEIMCSSSKYFGFSATNTAMPPHLSWLFHTTTPLCSQAMWSLCEPCTMLSCSTGPSLLLH